jgi:hypothetical protein
VLTTAWLKLLVVDYPVPLNVKYNVCTIYLLLMGVNAVYHGTF